MKILFVNPPEYAGMECALMAYNSSTYRVATWYKNQGNDVQVLNMRPEMYLPACPQVLQDREGFIYAGERITKHVGNRICGNWESEHISRPLIRIGFPARKLIRKLMDFKPDVVAISAMFTYNWEGVREVVAFVREHSNAKVWLGGIYPTLVPEHAMEHIRPDEIKGAVDPLIPTDLSLFDYKPFALDLLTGTGCPNSCGYCAVHLLEGHQRARRTPEQVLDEIQNAYNQGIFGFRFLDSNLLVGFETHFKVILEGIIKRKIYAKLHIYGGVDCRFVTKENLSLMHNAGMEFINVPIESTSERLLKKWGRKNTIKEWETQIERVREGGFQLLSNLLAGCYDQTTKEIQDTIDFVRAAGVRPVPLFYTPIPRTREYVDDGTPLENLNPFLYPLASDKMTVEDLEKIRIDNIPSTSGCLYKHPTSAKKPTVEEAFYAHI